MSGLGYYKKNHRRPIVILPPFELEFHHKLFGHECAAESTCTDLWVTGATAPLLGQWLTEHLVTAICDSSGSGLD